MMWNASLIDGPIAVPITWDQDGNATAYDPSYHMNIAVEITTPELGAFRVMPAQPVRIWAGDDAPYSATVFLKFTDEEEARTALSEYWQAPSND